MGVKIYATTEVWVCLKWRLISAVVVVGYINDFTERRMEMTGQPLSLMCTTTTSPATLVNVC